MQASQRGTYAVTRKTHSNRRSIACTGDKVTEDSHADSGSATERATASESRLGPPADRQQDRGQTTLDFATGMSVFLIILIAVLLFIPGSLEPFTKGAQDNIVTSNRVGDQLSEGMLGNPSSPHILNSTCTIAFFEGTTPGHGECRFTGSSLQERIGVQDRRLINVSLQGNLSTDGEGEDILCWDDSAGLLVEKGNTSQSCDTRFAIGDTPPNRADATVTARRVVSMNRSAGSTEKVDVALIVEVW